MGKLKLSTKIKDEKGNVLGTEVQCLIQKPDGSFALDVNGAPQVAVIDKSDSLSKTLKDVICDSLLNENPQRPLSGPEKSKRYKIWFKVNSAKDSIELPIEEIVVVKECVLDSQPILIAGQCEVIIEG